MGRRRPLTHALRVNEGLAAFRAVFAMLAESGERGGWLELDAGAPAAGDPSGNRHAADAAAALGGALAGALGEGVWKAVAVGERHSVAVKSRRGPPVLRDLLREHFQGCRLVLVRGESPLPVLRPRGDDWELVGEGGKMRRLTTAELAAALRAPHLPV